MTEIVVVLMALLCGVGGYLAGWQDGRRLRVVTLAPKPEYDTPAYWESLRDMREASDDG